MDANAPRASIHSRSNTVHPVTCKRYRLELAKAQTRFWRTKRLKILRLSRNFGKEVALAVGLAYASGDVVVLMMPIFSIRREMIETFVERWRHGYDVVYGVRRVWTGRLPPPPPGVAPVLSVVLRFGKDRITAGRPRFSPARQRRRCFQCRTERSRFNNGLFAWLGFSRAGL